MAKIFVYGTLMNNMNAFVPDAQLLFDNVEVDGFAMYSLGGFPGIVETAARHDKVYGQIWEIPTSGWNRLDQYEGFDSENPDGSLYRRLRLPMGYVHPQPNMNEAFLRSRVEYYHYNSIYREERRVANGRWGVA